MGLANSSWSLDEDKQLHSLVEKTIKSPYVIRNSLYSELLSPPFLRFRAPSWVLRAKEETVTVQKELWVSGWGMGAALSSLRRAVCAAMLNPKVTVPRLS